MKVKKRNRGYVYTDKKHSLKGAYSTVLGLISMVSMILCITKTVELQGEALPRFGVTAIFALGFSLAGMITSFFSFMENGRYYLLSYIGLITNVLTLVGLIYLLVIGR